MSILGAIVLAISIGLNIILFCGVLKFSEGLQDALLKNQEDRKRYEAMLKNTIFQCQRCKKFVSKKNIKITQDNEVLCPECYKRKERYIWRTY